MLRLLMLLLLSHHTREGFGHVEKWYWRRELGHLVEVERVLRLKVDLLQGWHLAPLGTHRGFLSLQI